MQGWRVVGLLQLVPTARGSRLDGGGSPHDRTRQPKEYLDQSMPPRIASPGATNDAATDAEPRALQHVWPDRRHRRVVPASGAHGVCLSRRVCAALGRSGGGREGGAAPPRRRPGPRGPPKPRESGGPPPPAAPTRGRPVKKV